MSRNRQFLFLSAFWVVCGAAFYVLQDDWSWNVLFPALGVTWMAGPLVLTRLDARFLHVVSASLLASFIAAYLALVWMTVSIFGFIGSLVFELEGSSSIRDLFVDGLKTVPGALVGTALGLAIRSRAPGNGNSSPPTPDPSR